MSTTAAAESAGTSAPAVVIDPAAVVDVDGFASRAASWTAAQQEHREAGLERAERLAAQTKATELEAEQEAEEAARLEAEEHARREAEEAARLEAEEQAAATTTTTIVTTTTTVAVTETAPSTAPEAEPEPQPSPGPTAQQWSALRECESSNNYGAVNPSGRYRGAYQFSVPTWDWLAGISYPELVGVDPAAASPADQDRMAQALYDIHGASPWPTCGSLLL